SWHQPPLRGQQPVRHRGRHLSRLLCAAGRRAGATDRRVEERLADGPVVVPSFSGQRAEIAGAHAGVCVGGAAPGSGRSDPGSSDSGGEHATAAVVESRRPGQDQRAADLVSLLGELAEPGTVRPGVRGGAAVRGGTGTGADGLAPSRSSTALVTVRKFRKAAPRRPGEIPWKNGAKMGL